MIPTEKTEDESSGTATKLNQVKCYGHIKIMREGRNRSYNEQIGCEAE